MESRIISIEQTSDGPNITQHYQQHFQQHYAATGDVPPVIVPTAKYPQPINPNVLYESHHQEKSSSNRHTPTSSFESHSQLFQSNSNSIDHGAFVNLQQKHEQASKKTVQTTTTTTTSPTTYILADNTFEPIFLPPPPVAFQTVEPLPIQYVPVNTISSDVSNASQNENSKIENEQPYTIHVEHLPQNASSWRNVDTYLHIFLTFYFGHFAAMLFFDGILRSIVNLFILKHTSFSPFIYIFHIIFSICLLAFTIWFMTVCWRWWRNKSLEPINGLTYYDYAQQKPNRLRDRQSTAHKYVLIAAFILILSFFIFLIIGLVDLNFKRENELYLNQTYGIVSGTTYVADLIVFIFRLIFWIVGIVATLLLCRSILEKYLCPSKHIKINKEKPTTVYHVRA